MISKCVSCRSRAAEELLEIVMRRYERASTLLTSNRPVEDWGKLLGDAAAVSGMLDRLLHHGHVLKCGPLARISHRRCFLGELECSCQS
jgi:DNA replication protein DnaC